MGGGRYRDVAWAAGVDGIEDGRGVVSADFDGDGRLDLVVANQAKAPTLYHNRTTPETTHWLAVQLVGTESNRDAIGARVRVRIGDVVQSRWVQPASGFASQQPRTLHFGLGDAHRIDRIEITWPSGRTQVLPGQTVDRTMVIREESS